MNYPDSLIAQLKALAFKIESELQANISVIQQEVMTFINYKILDFEYTEEGVQFSKSQHEYTNQNYYKLPQDILKLIKNNLDYNSILQTAGLNTVVLDPKLLDRFIDFIIDTLLNKATSIKEEIDTIILLFLKDIYQEPFKFSAVVELTGIVVELESIEFDLDEFKIVLRQTKVEDLQKKYVVYPYLDPGFQTRRAYSIPSSIINIQSYGNEPYRIQDKIQNIVTAFRLFKVSSTEYTSYSMDSEAILWSRKIGGTISSIKQIDILEKLRITRDNASELVEFCRRICDVMPKSMYNSIGQEKDMIHLAIAYRHYSEALLNQDSIEEKITNVVIGLESLLLAENQEISFRFWVRGAKILSLLNYPPLRAKKILKIGYEIRSTFVHGDDLELDKKLRKLNESHQETKLFLVELLDYLRELIVIMIFLSTNKDFVKSNKETKNFDKKKFLEIVDDSLIAMERENQLRDLLNCKKFLA